VVHQRLKPCRFCFIEVVAEAPTYEHFLRRHLMSVPTLLR